VNLLFKTSVVEIAISIPQKRRSILLDGIRGEESIASICTSEGMLATLYTNAGKRFYLEVGKKPLKGDTVRKVSSHEVNDLKKENEYLKQ
jgi:transposase